MMSSKRQLSSSPSAAEITMHNEDLMTEISLNLPVASILRFGSVSKQWHSQLNQPPFIKRYASHARRNSMLFLLRNLDFGVIDSLHLNGNNHDLDISDFGYLRNPSDKGNLYLVHSCNGLLLFNSREARVQVPPGINRFYVSNPFTKKFCELVVPDYLSAAQGFLSSYLSFDPCTSPCYKVIFFWNDDVYSSDYHISIYSSDTKTCKNFDHTFDNLHPFLHSYSGVYFNGAIFWMDYHLKNSTYFDINQESFKKNVLPKPPYSGPNPCAVLKYFGGYGSHVHLIYGNRTDPILDVYELKEDCSRWIAKYKIDIQSIAMEFPEIILSRDYGDSEKRYKYSVLSVIEKKEEPIVVLYAGNKLLAYNFIDKTTKKLDDVPSLGNNCNPYSRYGTFHCIESLFSV